MKSVTYFYVLSLSLSLFACGGSSDDENVLVYQLSVAAKPDYYSSQVMHTLRLNAMGIGSGGPDTTVNGIEGFDHSFGTKYTIEISSMPDVVDGTPIQRKKLIRTISSNRDAIGTKYTYANFELVGNFLKLENDLYSIPPYEFFCAEDVDCETLFNMSNSGGLVALEFTLTDNMEVPITLTSWQ
jgi:hypothetical protein